jgi:hypothetical protein
VRCRQYGLDSIRIHQSWQTAGTGGDLAGPFSRNCPRCRPWPSICLATRRSLLTGLGAPRNTSAEIIAIINKETNSALADPKIKAQLAALGNTVLPGSPADFGRLIAEETDKWAKVVKFANIKPE